VAIANGARLELGIEWIVSDGFAALAGRRFDVIAANPPYLSEQDLAAAPAELSFEPRGALVAGPRGDETIDRLVREAPGYLAPGGVLVIEVGEGQAAIAVQRLGAAGFAEAAARDDLAGIARTVLGRLA